MENQWYHFQKIHQGRISAETYKDYPKEWEQEIIKGECEEWAERVNQSGFHRGYEYKCSEVLVPPKKWLIDKILESAKEVRRLKSMSKRYKSLILENQE